MHWNAYWINVFRQMNLWFVSALGATFFLLWQERASVYFSVLPDPRLCILETLVQIQLNVAWVIFSIAHTVSSIPQVDGSGKKIYWFMFGQSPLAKTHGETQLWFKATVSGQRKYYLPFSGKSFFQGADETVSGLFLPQPSSLQLTNEACSTSKPFCIRVSHLLAIVFNEFKKRLWKYLFLRQQATGLHKWNVYFHIKKKTKPTTFFSNNKPFYRIYFSSAWEKLGNIALINP